MLKYIDQGEKKYNGQTYRPRRIVGHPDALRALSKVKEAIVYSSWRSLAEQKKLVAEGKSKTLQSNHRRGTAFDCVNWKEIEPKMRKAGLINDISLDRNHFTLGGEAKAANYPIIDNLPDPLTKYAPESSRTPKKPKTTPKPTHTEKTSPASPQSVTSDSAEIVERIGEILAQEVKPTTQDKINHLIDEPMETLRTAWQSLSGYKTYLVAALMIALGLLTDNKELVLQGLGLAALRNGVK